MRAAVRVIAVASLLLFGRSVVAQPAEGEAAKPLSDREKADAGAESIGAMRDVLTSVNKLVEEARNERDALKLNCVNERKSQISGLVKVAELSLEELKAATKERQSEAVDHEFEKIKVARQKVDGYKTEADQCIGLLAFYEGGEQVERQLYDDNKDSKNLDPTTPQPLEPTPFRPPPASPIR